MKKLSNLRLTDESGIPLSPAQIGAQISEVLTDAKNPLSQIGQWEKHAEYLASQAALVVDEEGLHILNQQISNAIQNVRPMHQRLDKIIPGLTEPFRLVGKAVTRPLRAEWKRLTHVDREVLNAAKKVVSDKLIQISALRKDVRVADERKMAAEAAIDQATAQNLAETANHPTTRTDAALAATAAGAKAVQHQTTADQLAAQPQADILNPTFTDKGATVSEQIVTRWAVENAGLVPREYCIPDPKLIDAAVKGGATIPGVRVWTDKKTVLRAKSPAGIT